MADKKQAVTESSPDSQVKDKTETKATESVVVEESQQLNDSVVEAKETADKAEEVDKVEDKTTDKTKKDSDKEPKTPNKTEKRFKKLFSKLEEKDRQLKQYNNRRPDEIKQIDVKYDKDGTPIVDPNNLIKVAEDRAYQRALQAMKDQNVVKDIQRQAGEFLEDAETVSEDIKSSPALEKMATKMFEAENYVISPATGEKVFLPKKKLSVIVKELQEDMSEISAKAQAELSDDLKQDSETSAIKPGVTTEKREYSDEAAIKKAQLSGKTEDWNAIIKNRLYQ